MPGEHRRRHAQQVRADVEALARELARLAAPAIDRGDPAQEERVGNARADRPDCRRAEQPVCQTQRTRHGRGQLVQARPFRKRVAKVRIFAAELSHQPVDVPEVAHAPRQVAIGDHMRGGMADHVRRRERVQTRRQLSRIGDQRRGIGLRPGGQRQDGVVHVDHPVALRMDQRRQLVHPLAVIGIVIGIGLDPFPARCEQKRLDLVQPVARDENVEIADRPPDGSIQPGGGEGGALEQHHAARVASQRHLRAFGLP